MADLTGPGVRVLVIGTETHHGNVLRSVPVVGRTLTALVDRLTSRCGVPAEQLTALHDPPDALAVARAVTTAAQQAKDILLIWYVGHGLRLPKGGELHLAASSTDHLVPGLAAQQAYPVSSLWQAVDNCRAATKVIVLDCCFSGRADLGASTPDPLAGLPPVHGVYSLTSAEQLAQADPAQEHTAFSGEFIRFLDEGDADAGRRLTLDDAYYRLIDALPKRHAPLPWRREAGQAGRLILTVNPAHRGEPTPQPDAEPVEQSPGPSPWRGLAPFREQDAPAFFGREAVTKALRVDASRRLRDPGPLLVLGPSGSGKTSLLHAGLLAVVRRDGLATEGGDPVWPLVLPPITPGREPMAALARIVKGDPTHLLEHPAAAAELLDQHAEDRPALVVVDQLEELFTLGADEAVRAAFLDALAALATPRETGTVRAVVVTALRADFYGSASEDRAFAGLLAGPRLVVGPMMADELRRTIEGPAAQAGLRLDDGLAELLLHELGAGRPRGPEPGALPLLSHVLWETWCRRQGNQLSVAAYRDSGGLNGAIAKTADDTYEKLDPDQQRAAHAMLLRLVRVGSDGVDTARPLLRAELLYGLGGSAAMVLEQLAARRLVGIGSDEVVRISHETLVTAWPRLRTWVNDDRERLLVRQRFTEAARDWQDGQRRRDNLLRGRQLTDARRSVPADGIDQLGPVEREFLARSLRWHRARRCAVVLAGVLVLALVAGAVILQEQRVRAERLDAQIASRRLAAQADALRSREPEAAFHLSLAAYRASPTPEARQELYASFAEPRAQPLRGHEKAVLNLAYTPDGKILVSSAGDQSIRLWDVSDPRVPAEGAVIPQTHNTAIAVSPTRPLLAGTSAGSLRLWDITDPHRPQERAAVPSSDSPVFAAAFAPDGRTLATGGEHGTLRLWDLRDPDNPALLIEQRHGATAIAGVAFSRDSRLLAAAHYIEEGKTQGGQVTVWDVGDPGRPVRQSTLSMPSATAVAFSPVADLLVAAGTLGTVAAWDVGDPRRPTALPNDVIGDPRTDGSIFSLAFRTDGNMFATASTTGAVRLWQVDRIFPDSPEIDSWGRLPGAEPDRAVTFRPDGRSLASGADSGLVRVWSTPLTVLTGRVEEVGAPVPGRAFGFEGRYLLTSGSWDASSGARLWDMTDAMERPPALVAGLPPAWPSAVFLPDGRTVISKHRDANAVRLWNLADPRHPVALADLHWTGSASTPVEVTREPDDTGEWPRRSTYLSVVASPDGHYLAFREGQQRGVVLVDVRDPAAPKVSVRLDTDESGDGVWFLEDRTIAVWNAEDIELWDVRDPTSPVRAGVMRGAAQSGTFLYQRTRHIAFTEERDTGTNQALLRLWDLSDSSQPRRAAHITMDDRNAGFLVTDPDTLAIDSEDGVRVWDISNLDEPVALQSLTGRGTRDSLDLSPDGLTLAATDDLTMGSISVWRRNNRGDTFTAFAEVPGGLSEFAPDSSFLVGELPLTGSASALAPEGGVALWPLDADQVHRQLCEASPPRLSDEDWERLAPGLDRRAPCGPPR